ncbi:MAG: hypothetical protein HYZ71_14530 [Deltaproteobacteria bacterium]|nr:hypothetical protein [Deltaproteobacteria bacterium]
MKMMSIVALMAAGYVMAAPVTTTSGSFAPGHIANTVLAIGPAIQIPGASKALPGIEFSAVTAAAPSVPLYVGVDASFFFTTDTANKFVGSLPILGTMYYEFQTGGAVRPKLGVSAGPVFGIGDNQQSARFGMLATPALHIRMAETVGITIESKIGVFGSEFVYMPQVAAHFAM